MRVGHGIEDRQTQEKEDSFSLKTSYHLSHIHLIPWIPHIRAQQRITGHLEQLLSEEKPISLQNSNIKSHYHPPPLLRQDLPIIQDKTPAQIRAEQRPLAHRHHPFPRMPRITQRAPSLIIDPILNAQVDQKRRERPKIITKTLTRRKTETNIGKSALLQNAISMI